MQREGTNYVLVGAVVAIAIVLLLVALALMTGRRGAMTTYVVRYADVTGLRDGAPVYFQGFRVGQVTGIAPERSATGTRFRVRIGVRHDWPLPADSVAALQATGLLADVAIAIHGGSSATRLAAGGELKGEEGGNLFIAMNGLASELTVLTRDQLTPLVHTLAQRVDSIGGAVDAATPELMHQARTLLEQLNTASLALNDVLKPGNREALHATLAQVATLSRNLDGTRAALDKVLAEANAGIADNRADVRRAVQDLVDVLGTVSSRVDATTHHLESASRNLDAFSREIRAHPNRLLLSPPPDAPEGQP